MTDKLREAAQTALDALESKYIVNCGAWRIQQDKAIEALRAALANEFNPDWDQVEALQESLREHMAEIQRLRAALAQPEQEPVATLFGSLPVYDVPTKQEPVAWVETLENARPHCVTDLNYLSVAQHERGEHLKYIPLYIDPTPCQTCEALARTVMMDQTSHDNPPQREWQGLTDEEIRNEAKNHVFDESFFSGAIWARGQIMGKNNE